jgi:hypothetical protein
VRKLIVILGGAFVALVGLLASAAAAQTTGASGTTVVVGGQQVSRAAQTQVSASSGSLAFTGSSHLLTYLLVGLVAVVVGMLLVMATRRRAQVLQRA